MILRNFLLADAITFAPGGKVFVHGGSVGKLFASHFPWAQPQLAAFVTLVAEPGDDLDQQHALSLGFVTSEGEHLQAKVGGAFHLPESGRPEVPRSVNFATNFVGAVFPYEGVYWLRADLDGAEIGRLPVEVERREAPSGWIPLDAGEA